MAYQQSDFEVFSTRPKKAVRNSDGVRVIEDYSTAEWDEAKASAQAQIDNYQEIQKNLVRQTRTHLLTETDWSILPDSPLSAEDVTKMKTWRQELRDLPSIADVDDTVYPACPVASVASTIHVPTFVKEGTA